MEKMNPIGWVEISVTDLDRAEKFYGNYFGFEFERQAETAGYTMSWFPMDMKQYGAATTLVHGKGYEPSHKGSLVYFTAPEEGITASLEKAAEQNVNILMPLQGIGDHGFIACIEDSEGNKIAIHSMKK